jgi:hypothetical protein
LARVPLISNTASAFFANDGVVVGEVGRVCVVIWRGGVTREMFERQRAGLVSVVARYPEGSGFLCVIEPTATPPDDELRRASIEMVASHTQGLKCVAVVIEGEGFRAAITRSVISGMTLLYRRKPPASVFPKVREAVGWMRLNMRIASTDAVVTAVEELRKLLGAQETRG